MSEVAKSRRVWETVRGIAAAHPDPRGLRIPRGRLPHPRDAGARLTTTWPVGQMADYAIDGSPGEAPLAIREFPDHWEVFIESAQLAGRALATLDEESSKAAYLAAFGAVMLGGSIGASVTNKRSGVLLGAGLGLLFAALVTAALDDAGGPAPPVLGRRHKKKPA